jgi:hypothetical protein
VPEEEFVNALKASYEKEFDNGSDLDSKAASMITMSGTISTLFFGFGTLFLKEIPSSKVEVFLPASIILIIETILLTFIIKYAVDAYKVKGDPYYTAIPHEQFINSDGQLNEKMVKGFVNMDKKLYNKRLIEGYIKGIDENIKKNHRKREKIVHSQHLFKVALLIIPIFASIIVFYRIF